MSEMDEFTIEVNANLHTQSSKSAQELYELNLPIQSVSFTKKGTSKIKNNSSSVSVRYNECCQNVTVIFEDSFENFGKPLESNETAYFPASYSVLDTEAETNVAFDKNVLTPVQQLFKNSQGLEFNIRAQRRQEQFTVDISLEKRNKLPSETLEHRYFLTVEGKKFSAFLRNLEELDINKLKDGIDFTREGDRFHTLGTNCRNKGETDCQFNFRMGVKQLTSYLDAMNTARAYGILTSYCQTYFAILERDQDTSSEPKETGTLRISPVLKYDDNQVIKFVTEFIHLAIKAERKPINPIKRPIKVVSPGKIQDQRMTRSHTKRKREENQQLTRSHTKRKREEDNGAGEETTNSERGAGDIQHQRMVWDFDYITGDIIAEGRTGPVLRLTDRKGHSFAAKTIGKMTGKRRHEKKEIVSELENEERMYKKLSNLQGNVMPMFHCSGYLNGSYALITKELEADPLWKCKPSDQQKKVIVSALKSIHEHGILHRDVRPDNILLDRQESKAYFLDFAFSAECDLLDDFEREMNKLKAILDIA